MIDYDAFTQEERDNFVRNVLTESEIKAAMLAHSRGGRVFRTPDQYLEFCFRIAVRKMQGLHDAIRRKREKETG